MSLQDTPPLPRAVRSFVMRQGRTTPAQQRALEAYWPTYGLSAEAPGRPLDLADCFERAAPCTLEIGFGNGEHLLARAVAEPARNFLGIEVHRPGVGHLLLGAHAAGLTNLRLFCTDAVDVLAQCIAPVALDEIQILFPDPWPKKRHHKRRLIQPAFVALLSERLRSGGTLHLASDWEPYAEEMLAVLSAHPALYNAAGTGFAPRPDSRAPTKFERRGTRLGHVVRDLTFIRR